MLKFLVLFAEGDENARKSSKPLILYRYCATRRFSTTCREGRYRHRTVCTYPVYKPMGNLCGCDKGNDTR